MSFTYVYDPLGNNAANLIVAEEKTVTVPSDPEKANFIVPVAAPFFGDSMVVRTGPLTTDTELVEGTDFIFTHYFVEASVALGKRIFGSIMFVNREYSTPVYLTYQTLGGPYTLADTSIVTNMTRSLYALRVVTWAQIVGLPVAFPPLPHPTDSVDLTGAAELVAKLDQILTAIVSNGTNLPALAEAFHEHITESEGAHEPGAVGLGLVANYPPAEPIDIDTLRTDRVMTPAMFAYAVSRFAPGSLPKMYGIGDVLSTTRTTDPATFLMYGTWEALGDLTIGTTLVHFWLRTA